MPSEMRRPDVAAGTARSALDYYLIFPETRDGAPSAQPDGIVVEQFMLADDHTATGLATTVWTAADGGWRSSAAFSRAIRSDPRLRARIVPVRRGDAETAYRRLGEGALPDETTLRTYFLEHASLPGSPPLLLTPPEVPEGFHEKRVYRILFAGHLRKDRLAYLHQVLGMTLAGPQARVLGTGHLRVAGDAFTWELCQIGGGMASCVDLTAYLGDPPGDTVGALLRELMTIMRYEGLIPVTIERFC
ncbi:hypothetical protein GCM10022226_45560 [Sphaerisporangium flaviroseum]|uniref:Uncharacterized protein n=1 Tax=Sphaerisporangium flaviroseum TaxID=509199 RepID=A0ABP7IJH0_9ACTN